MDVARAMAPADFEFQVVPEDDPDFPQVVRDAEYFMGFPREHMGQSFYDMAPNMKLVQLLSAGYDRLDVEAARAARVPVSNNGGSNSVAVAEHTLMLILAVYKQVVRDHLNVVNGKWRVGNFAELQIYELAGKTLGLVGLGTIGKKVARRAQAFDMRVQYHDTIRLAEDQEDALGVRFILLPELLRTSDVVSLHVPLNEQTRNMMGAREFATMKNDAIFINTCRGPGRRRGGAVAGADQRSDCRRRSGRVGGGAAADRASVVRPG